jgi:hypothetical protein
LLPDAWAVRNRSPQRPDDLPASMQREVEELPGTLPLAENATAECCRDRVPFDLRQLAA